MVRVRNEVVHIVDPGDPAWTWGFDLGFMLSHYKCIFGEGCPSIENDGSTRGCCVEGVVIVGEKDDEHGWQDLEMLEGRIAQLTDEDWEKKGMVERRDRGPDGRSHWSKHEGSESVVHTRTHKGACVFYNGPDHPAGTGCSFHIAALRRGEDPKDWKPWTCWVVPMFVDTDDEKRSRTIRAGHHRDWSEGTLKWWCMDAPEAYVGEDPVFIANRDELIRHSNEEVYEALAEVCRDRQRGQAIRLPTHQPLSFIGSPPEVIEPDGTDPVPKRATGAVAFSGARTQASTGG
jgi:hypothetical protein